MSVDTENIDHDSSTDDKIYDELEKLIDSVDAEEKELKVSFYLSFYLLLYNNC